MSKVYEIVTEKVLEALNRGTLPWRKPWDAAAVRPHNAVTHRPYNGGNYFLLGMLPYAVPAFMTFNQIKAAGAKIKEGQEKRHFPVFFWTMLERKNDKGTIEKIPMLRFFLVWNIEQVEGFEYTPESKPVHDHSPIEEAEAIVKGFKNAPEMVIAVTDRACYYPAHDKVNVPSIEQYNNPQEYYSTLFHELAHSTGHASRLNRKEVTNPNTFGSHDYSVEELVAELTAAFLCAEAGLDNTLDNSAAYIASWHKALSNDPKMFWTAAGRAQKAADHILGRNANND